MAFAHHSIAVLHDAHEHVCLVVGDHQELDIFCVDFAQGFIVRKHIFLLDPFDKGVHALQGLFVVLLFAIDVVVISDDAFFKF